MSGFTQADIIEFGRQVQALLLDGDDAILIDIGAMPPSSDCDIPTCTATISGVVVMASERFTGHAVDLNSAVWIARGKLREARERHREATAKAKAKATGEQP